MNSVSPYVIRCFNPQFKGKNVEDGYYPLGAIGQADMYDVLKKFVMKVGSGFNVLEDTKQVYAFSDVVFDDVAREFYGVIKAGSYGSRTEIIDINTGEVDFHRFENNAETMNHYVHFYVPEKLNEGVAILHNRGNIGVKTLIHSILSVEFRRVTGRVMQMNPLSYDKAINDWANATAKEIKMTRFSGMNSIEEQIKKLGHNEAQHTYVIKASRKQSLGKLSDFLTPGTDQGKMIELLSEMCEEVKTVVELGGRKRTFRLGVRADSQVCEIDVDEAKVEVKDGSPNIAQLHAWCKILLNDFLLTMYPGMGIRV